MADHEASMSTGAGTLSQRPGWRRLECAAEELHAAEILLQDPVAAPRTALPHLRAFWSWCAASVALHGGSDEADPGTWLAGDAPIVGIDARQRARLEMHWASVSDTGDGSSPSAVELRRHTADARRLLAALEPEIGGQPLRRRRRRIAIGVAGVLLVLGPIVGYALTRTALAGSGPWRAAYYPDRKLESEPVVVREQSVDHNWEDRPPHEQIPPDKFSARWDTCLNMDAEAEVVFQVNANDGARVFVDGELVIDAWEKNKTTRRRGFGSVEMSLSPGLHHLQVEYFESLGRQKISLVASLDGGVPKALPNDRLRYPGDEINEDDPCGDAGD